MVPMMLRHVTRNQLLERAQACGWPPVTYHGATVVGEETWRSRGFSCPGERRALFEELAALAASAIDPAGASRRRRVGAEHAL
jgi:hypothetical protein